eukprot:655309-Amphidinium_carterae.1
MSFRASFQVRRTPSACPVAIRQIGFRTLQGAPSSLDPSNFCANFVSLLGELAAVYKCLP